MKKYKFHLAVFVEILIMFSFYLHYIFKAFVAWGEGAIALVAVPGSFLLLGVVIFLGSMADPKDREKFKKRWESFRKWFNKDRENNEVIFWFPLGAIDFIILLTIIIPFLNSL